MVASTRNILINIAVSVCTALFVVFGTHVLDRKSYKSDVIDDELKKKASYEYVDKRDGEIQSEVKDFKVEQEKRHSTEMQQVDKKLDLIIKLIDAKK